MALLFIIAVIFWSGEKATQAPTSEMASAFDKKFIIAMVIASLGMLVLFRKKIISRNSIYLAILVGGAAFAVIFVGIIRYFPKLLLYLAGDHLEAGLFVLVGRYGSRRFWSVLCNEAKKDDTCALYYRCDYCSVRIYNDTP